MQFYTHSSPWEICSKLTKLTCLERERERVKPTNSDMVMFAYEEEMGLAWLSRYLECSCNAIYQFAATAYKCWVLSSITIDAQIRLFLFCFVSQFYVILSFFFFFNHFHARDPKIFNDMLCAAPNLLLKHSKLLLRWWWYEVLQYRKFIVFISIQYSCIYIYFLIVKVKYFSKRIT